MVFYHTSANIKMMRNIMLDYESVPETSSYEYMKTYVENCPENVDDAKLTWIAEVFIGMQKHRLFLKEIARHVSEDLSEEELDYFMIVLLGITFHIQPKDMQSLYKSLFNISKQLLCTFTNFLSNNEVLTFISQVAQAYYDADFVTNKIIAPLFIWQPYISEMAHNYAEFLMKMESRKIKPLTVPVQPTVLSRKGKESVRNPSLPTLPITPPNSIHKARKLLTKSAIDRKLEKSHEKNKKKAEKLLNDANRNLHVPKCEKSDKKLSVELKDIQSLSKLKKSYKKTTGPPVRQTEATIKKMNKRIEVTEQEEMDWFYDLVTCFRNPMRKLEDVEESERQERERQRLYDIEKKHLMGQISYEEAVLAKQKVQEQNKKKCEALQKEKEMWNQEIEQWKNNQIEEVHKRIEQFALDELNKKEAINNLLIKHKENATRIKKESEMLAAKILKEKKEELERRSNMIKEIKVLSIIAKKARIPKVIDLTETSGLGLLCEMSMAELQERITGLKIGIEEDIEKRRAAIMQEKEEAKNKLENVKAAIKSFIDERADIRKRNMNIVKKVTLDDAASKELNALKKSLEEKRKMRTKALPK